MSLTVYLWGPWDPTKETSTSPNALYPCYDRPACQVQIIFTKYYSTEAGLSSHRILASRSTSSSIGQITTTIHHNPPTNHPPTSSNKKVITIYYDASMVVSCFVLPNYSNCSSYTWYHNTHIYIYICTYIYIYIYVHTYKQSRVLHGTTCVAWLHTFSICKRITCKWTTVQLQQNRIMVRVRLHGAVKEFFLQIAWSFQVPDKVIYTSRRLLWRLPAKPYQQYDTSHNIISWQSEVSATMAGAGRTSHFVDDIDTKCESYSPNKSC